MHSSCTARLTICHLPLFAVVSHSAYLAAVVSLQRHLAISTKLPRRSPLRCLPGRATKSKCFNQTLHFQCKPLPQRDTQPIASDTVFPISPNVHVANTGEPGRNPHTQTQGRTCLKSTEGGSGIEPTTFCRRGDSSDHRNAVSVPCSHDDLKKKKL